MNETKRRAMVDKAIHRALKIEQHEPGIVSTSGTRGFSLVKNPVIKS